MLSEAERRGLIERAREVRGRAYAPYSGYTVGAALLAESGEIFAGVNVENSAYPLCQCAERSALGAAVSAGQRKFTAIAIVTRGDENGSPGSPCGGCRQALSEFGLGLEVILATPEGAAFVVVPLAELLPRAFSGERL